MCVPGVSMSDNEWMVEIELNKRPNNMRWSAGISGISHYYFRSFNINRSIKTIVFEYYDVKSETELDKWPDNIDSLSSVKLTYFDEKYNPIKITEFRGLTPSSDWDQHTYGDLTYRIGIITYAEEHTQNLTEG